MVKSGLIPRPLSVLFEREMNRIKQLLIVKRFPEKGYGSCSYRCVIGLFVFMCRYEYNGYNPAGRC